MKTLKLDHQLAEHVVTGEKTSTWRLFDDKDLSVNDTVRLIDKVDPERPETWRVIGTGLINQVIQKRLGDIGPEDMDGHTKYTSKGVILTTYRKYYGEKVNETTTVKIVHFVFQPLQQGN
jgi:hypothetical protein